MASQLKSQLDAYPPAAMPPMSCERKAIQAPSNNSMAENKIQRSRNKIRETRKELVLWPKLEEANPMFPRIRVEFLETTSVASRGYPTPSIQPPSTLNPLSSRLWQHLLSLFSPNEPGSRGARCGRVGGGQKGQAGEEAAGGILVTFVTVRLLISVAVSIFGRRIEDR